MRKTGAILVFMVFFSSGIVYWLGQAKATTLPSPVQPIVASNWAPFPQPSSSDSQTAREEEDEYQSPHIAKKSSPRQFIDVQAEDPPLQGESLPTYLNMSALRTFLAECKLADGGFMVRPVAQGIPISETWATFLVAWTSEFVGLRELVGTYRGRSPLDYFTQLATPTSGYWNSTLTPTVTMFSTALAFILWHTYPQELSLSASAPGEAALSFLLDAQEPIGGFAEPTARANLFTTALILQALAFAETQPHNPFTLRTYVQSLYQSGNGWFDDPELDVPHLWETWYGLWATHLVAPWQQFPEAKAYILSLQQIDGSWGSLADTFVALASLGLLGELAAVNHTQLLAYVQTCQYLNESSLFHGGFKDAPTAAAQTVSSLNSAYALYILHVLEGIAPDLTYVFAADQAYYIQGEPATVVVEAYYGDESVEGLNMTFFLSSVPQMRHWSGYDVDYGGYWQQIDTTSLFAKQSISYQAAWEPTFLTPWIQGSPQEGTIVVVYSLTLDVASSTLEPSMNTTYTITVSNTTTSVPYPVQLAVEGPDYIVQANFTTSPNGTVRPFTTTSDMLLGTYHVTATLVIPDTNVTMSAQATIEVDTTIEVKLEGLEKVYTVGDPLQVTVWSWYNSTGTFPNIPLTVHFAYHDVVSWATAPTPGTQGVYHIDTAIPLEPILGEVAVYGYFHFPDEKYYVDLGATTIRFTLTIDQVQELPPVAYLARPLQAAYVVSSSQIPAENLTDFRSYVNLTATGQVKNQTFSRQLEAAYQAGRYTLNWTVDPNLPATLYNVTIFFENPFGETVEAYRTTLRLESTFQLWIAVDFTPEVTPGEMIRLIFTLYWTDNPGESLSPVRAIGGVGLEATSTIPNTTRIPISFTNLAVGGYTLPGYGLFFPVPNDTAAGTYQLFLIKSATGELVATIEVQVRPPAFRQRYTWFVPAFVVILAGIAVLFSYVGLAQWRLGRQARVAQQQLTQEVQATTILKNQIRKIDLELQAVFKDPLLQGWPRKTDTIQQYLHALAERPGIKEYVELEKKRDALLETRYQRLREMQEPTLAILDLKEIPGGMSNKFIQSIRTFHVNPLRFVETKGIQALQSLATIIRRLVESHQAAEQPSFTHVRQLFSEQAMEELKQLDNEIHWFQDKMDVLKASEEIENQIKYYLEARNTATHVLQLQNKRQRLVRQLNEHLKGLHAPKKEE